MHPRLVAITEQLEHSRRELLASVPTQLAPADLARRPSSGAWSVAEILDHVATVESSVARLVDRSVTRAAAAGAVRGAESAEAAGAEPALDVRIVLDRGRRLEAPESVRPRAGVSAAEARSALDASRDALRGAIARADGYDLAAFSHPHPALGPLTMYQWLELAAHHERRHAAQIVETAGTRPPTPTPAWVPPVAGQSAVPRDVP